MKTIRTFRQGVWAAAVSLALLGGLAAESSLRPQADAAEPYHERIKALAAQAPMQIGDWVGADHRPPAEAIRLLKPNVILCRQYVNVRTGRSVQFLLVHCKDARDIHGHYPPVCYPGHGMKLRSAVEADWNVEQTRIVGKQYEFAEQRLGTGGKLVENFLIVPGHYVRDMDAVGERAGDYTQRFFGAAQVQVVFDDPRRWDQQQRREIFQTLIGAYLPLIEAIRNGAQP